MEEDKKYRMGWIMALYLLGLFIGALSTGIITPARTIIQNGLGVDDQTGIWMINIFTLCYAAVIPVSGKLADRYGRKIVYIISITLFAAGSVVCGLAEGFGSFPVLILGRIVQALGAGGIMPIATAEFGTSFPLEKRGMALGLVGGVYGIANVLGATAGSAILDIFGADKWQWIFYINVPLCALIIIGGLLVIPNSKREIAHKIDKLGTLLMTVIILALLYGLKNIDFFDFIASLTQTDVYPYLIAFIVLIPIFVLVEKRAQDPIFHIEYMRNRQIVVTLLMGLLVGASMMGMIFIPQFAENALKIPVGDGGYFVIILGLFAGAASPISGRLIDKYGSKPILGAGFLISLAGCLYLSFVATVHHNLLNVIISLVVIGLGMGLSMGTPLNYMMMRNTSDEESNSALATLSLVRSIGTAVAPAIMVGFIVQAAVGMDIKLMDNLPEIPEVPQMAQVGRLEEIVDELENSSDEARKMLADVDLDSMTDMSMDMDMDSADGDVDLPEDILNSLQTADVTNIVKRVQGMADYMFETNTADVIVDIQQGIGEGIAGIGEGIDGVNEGIDEMQTAVAEMDSAKAELLEGIEGISAGISGMESGLNEQDSAIEAMQAMLAMAEAGGPPGGDSDDQPIQDPDHPSDGNGENPPVQNSEQPSDGDGSDPPVQNPDIGSDINDNESDTNSDEIVAASASGGKASAAAGGSQNAVSQSDVMPQGMEGIESGGMPSGMEGMEGGGMPSGMEDMPMDIDTLKQQLAQLQNARGKLAAELTEARNSRASMQSAYNEITFGQEELKAAIDEAQGQRELMVEAQSLMLAMQQEIPQLFAQVKADYITAIEQNSAAIENVYQSTVNNGYRNMYICVGIFNLLGFLILLFYKDDRTKKYID